MALFVLGENNKQPVPPQKKNNSNNKSTLADISALISSANTAAEKNVNVAEANVLTIPREVRFDAVKPQHEKVYLDAFKIRNQLGQIIKKLSQESVANKGDPDCEEKLERMQFLVFNLYKYFVEVNNAFRLDPDQRAPKMKALINEFYADKTLKENLKILIPEGQTLPQSAPRPPQQQQQQKPRNQQKPKNQQQQRRNNKPRNQQQQRRNNKPRNQQQPRNNKPRNQQQQPRNNKPRNQQQQGRNNKTNNQTGELGIVNSIQELIF